MNSKSRDSSIDIMRGIAILLVVIGHIPYTPHLVRAWLYTFHVPLFFVCSGLLFSPERYPRFREFFISRVKGLLLPILTLGILSKLFQILMVVLFNLFTHNAFGYTTDMDPLQFILELLLGWRVHTYYYSLWFLYVLFLGEIVFYFLVKLLKKKWYFYVLLILAGIALQYLVSSFVCGFIWSIDTLPACLAFLGAGRLLRIVCYEKEKRVPVWLLPVAAVCSILFTWLNLKSSGDQVNLFYGQLWNPLYYLISALSGILLCVILSQLIGKSRFLEFFGRNSLVTYAFQNPFAIPLMMGLLQIWGTKNAAFNEQTLQWIITVTGVLLISALLSVLINRFAPFLLGKRKAGKSS